MAKSALPGRKPRLHHHVYECTAKSPAGTPGKTRLAARLAVWLAAAWAVVPGWAAAGESAQTLRWQFRAGDRFQVRMTQVTAAETVVQGRPVAVRMELQFAMLWRADRVTPDGAGEFTQTFTRFQARTTDADGRGTAYDSASAEVPADARELAESLRPLLNTPVQVTITARGELAAVTRPAETESLLGNQPALAGWKGLLTREGFRQLLQPALGLLPPQPVLPGTTWTETREIDLPAGRIRLADRYTYRGLRAPTPAASDAVAEIEVATERVEMGEKPAADTSPRQPGPYQGTLLFDLRAGRLLRTELQQTQAAPAAFRDAPLGLKTTNTVLLEISPATP